MEKIQELFIIMENRPGVTGEICRILKKKRISIYAIGIFLDMGRMYVSHPDKAVAALREHGYAVDIREVLRVSLPNRQGALMDFTMKLGNAGINIEYLYGALEEKQKRGTIILEVDKPDLAIDIFRSDRI